MERRIFWILYVVLILWLIFTTVDACAQKKCTTDTCHVNTESITAFCIKTTDKGKNQYFVVYDDLDQGISDIIPMSTNVYEYVLTCDQMKIAPKLGIVFKNNTPVRIIKYKKIGVNPKRLGKITVYKQNKNL